MRKNFTRVFAVLSAFVLMFNAHSQAQTITTVAGSSTTGGMTAPAEGVPATATTTWLEFPMGIIKDGTGSTGTLYIADEYDNMVRAVSGGIITDFAGVYTSFFGPPPPLGDGGPATAAYVDEPVDVGVDNYHNVYVAEAGSGRVRKITAGTGIINTIAGGGSATTAPYGDGGPATAASLTPNGIVVSPGGDTIYVSDASAGGGGFPPPPPSHNKVRMLTYSSSIGGYVINTYVGSGTTGFPYGDGGLATAAHIKTPAGLALDAAGNLYIADDGDNSIRMVNPTTGIISTVAGVTGGTAGYAGDGSAATSASVKLDAPTDVTVDASGNIYIADDGNLSARVRFVSHATGLLSTIAGDGYSMAATAPYGDGGPATSANLNAAASVAMDGVSSNYYITDGHNRIRYVTVTVSSSGGLSFVNGTSQTMTVCENSGVYSLNSMLQADETATGLTLTWSTVTAPTQGTLVAAYSTTSTGSAITPAGLSYTPTPGASGSDAFVVQVTDGTNTVTTAISVTITPLPVISPISAGASSMCIGGNILLSDITPGGVWSAANTNASVSGGGVTGFAAGTDNIYYKVTNACGSDSVYYTVTVNPSVTPAVTIASSLGTSTCGTPGTFTATPVNGGASPTYQWSVNGSAIGGATSSSYTYTPAAGDVVSVMMTGDAACATTTTASAAISMTGGAAVVPAISISTGIGDTVCVGVPITITSTVTNGGSSPTYNWTLNGVSSGSLATFPYVAGPLSDGDIIMCTLTSSIACADPTSANSNTIVIHVRSASTASVSITSTPGNTVCEGTSVTLSTTETGGGSSPFLRWSKSGVNVATGPTYTYVPANGDVIYCTMRSSIACSPSDTENSNVIIMHVDSPVAPTVVIAATRSIVAVNQAVTFSAAVTAAAAPTYQWYIDGTAVAGATSSAYTFTDSVTGTATISCEVGSGDACNRYGSSNLVSVSVVTNDQIRALSASSTELKVAPNPNNGTFALTLTSDINETAEVVITNVIGEKVKEFSITSNKAANITLGQPAGIYILTATAGSGTYQAKLVVN